MIHKEDLYDLEDTYEGICSETEANHKLNEAREWAEELFCALFDSGNINKIEGSLEELLVSLGSNYSLQHKSLKIANKQERDHLNWYLGYQRAHIDYTRNTQRTIEQY